MAKKILIIDDDPAIVKYLENLFRNNGYETCSGVDGIEGIEKLKIKKADLITLDLQMPEEWGTRFYRKLMKNEAYRDIPIIVISGLTGARYAIKKAAAFISKPFDPDHVLATVKKVLEESEKS